MEIRAKVVTAVAASSMMVLAGGCGSSAPQAARSAPGPTALATVPAALAADINARLDAQNGTLAPPLGSPSIQTAAEVRADSGGREHAADTLDAAGTQSLLTEEGNHGVRVVFHFPDASTAMADYERKVNESHGATFVYTIPGVPNSSGTDETGAGSGCGCRSAVFVIGDYEYRLGVSNASGPTPTHAQFIAMAKTWYDKLRAMG